MAELTTNTELSTADVLRYENARKSAGIAYALWFFLGLLGVHRFYVGKVATGVLMLLTLGGFGLWWIIDVFLVSGMVRQHNNKLLDVALTPPPTEEEHKARLRFRSRRAIVLTVLAFVLYAVIAQDINEAPEAGSIASAEATAAE